MARHGFGIGLIFVLLLLFNPISAAPAIDRRIVPPEPKGTRGIIVVNASGGGDYIRIQDAIRNSSKGDTIIVKKGIYNENIWIYQNINLIGSGWNDSIISGTGSGNVIEIQDNVNISGFSIVKSGSIGMGAGINFHSASHCKIFNNNISGHRRGIELSCSSSKNLILNNIFYNNGNGISYGGHGGSLDTVIERNVFIKNYIGIDVGGSVNYGRKIINNTFISNDFYGLSLLGTKDFEVCNNTFINNAVGDMKLVYITDCRFSGNLMTKGLFFQAGPYLDYWLSNEIDKTNLVNNEPVVFMKNSNRITIPSNIGQIILANCTNITIEGHNFNNTYCGINLGHSRNCVIANATFRNNHYGIYSTVSSNNEFDDNSFNENYRGLEIHASSLNKITNNTYYRNEIGLKALYSSRNEIVNNNFSSNKIGIKLYDTDESQWPDICMLNRIHDNSFTNNQLYAVVLDNFTHNNVVYHNKFIDNEGYQAYDNGDTNYWNLSFTGNYWSNWTIPDLDKDAIVDTPFEIPGTGNSVDPFPLVAPMEEISPISYAGSDIYIVQHEKVVFNGSSSTHLNFIINYSWSFMYDNKSRLLYGITPTFEFDIPGAYTIQLKTESVFGSVSYDSMVVFVGDITPPISDAGPNTTILQHQTVSFNGSGSHDNIGIVNYSWMFVHGKENIVLYGPNPTYSFHDAGEYTITLNVTDAEGNWATDTLNVTVLDITPPLAYVGPDITINQSDTVEFFFHQNSSDNIGCWNWTWTFQYNNTTQILFHSIPMSSLPFFTFEIPDNYTVTMTVYDEAGNWAVDVLNITVLNLSLPNETELDTDNDTYNDTFELSQGSNPYNPLSTPFDWDADGWNNSIETQVGTDPRDNLSIPPDLDGDSIPDSIDPDRDGDGVANVNDVYPGDSDRWEKEENVEQSESAVNVWVGIVIIVSIISVAGVILYLIKKRKEKEVEQSSEDDLGRVEKGEIEESE